MKTLIRFLQKHHFVLLFISLEIVSILLLSRSHSYHRAVLTHATNNITGKLYEWNNTMGSYLSLHKQNQMLQQQNAVLLEELNQYKTNSDYFDSMSQPAIFEFIPARVISNTVHLRNNYFIINKGVSDGIRQDMGVISPEGIAGIIIGTSAHYSTALSLLHRYASLSVRLQNSGQLANLKWEGGSYTQGEIVDIPTHVQVNKGDTIVTSGHSFVFPEGMPVGIVEEFIPSTHGGLNSAYIRFSTDFNSLRQVYIIKNTHKEELDTIENTMIHE